MRFAFLLTSVLALAGCARRYPVRGMVVEVRRAEATMVVSHDRIAGYMEAMVMPFHVARSADLGRLEPGTEIRFQLVVHKGSSRAERIETRKLPVQGGEPILLPDPPGKLSVGDPVPAFTLTDQSGAPFRWDSMRGKVVAINFLYTRCPLPEVCPRLAANFARLQNRFAARMPRDLMLLSVTIDPQHDTPDELRRYATIWKARPEGWRFLTGRDEEIRTVAGAFGLVSWPEEGLITHTSRTAIVSREGRLAAAVDGSSYVVGQLGDLIEKELGK